MPVLGSLLNKNENEIESHTNFISFPLFSYDGSKVTITDWLRSPGNRDSSGPVTD